MRNIVIGIVLGAVLGIVVGATVIAPRLQRNPKSAYEVARQLPRALIARPAVTLKMASAFDEDTPVAGPLARRIENRLWEVSNGQFELRFYPPGSLMADEDLLGAVVSGTADAAFAPADLDVSTAPAMQLFAGFPFGPGPVEYLAWLEVGGGRALLDEINHARKLHGIPCGLLPPSTFGWFQRDLQGIQDLRGMRIDASGVQAELLQGMGAETVDLPRRELPQAVQQGRIDGVAGASPVFDAARGLQSMFKIYYAQSWPRSLTMLQLVFNLKRWEQLGAPLQAQAQAVCNEAMQFSIAEGEGIQFAALKNLFAQSVRLLRLPSNIRQAGERSWQQLVLQQTAADNNYRRVWDSLSAFRADFAVWRDVSRP